MKPSSDLGDGMCVDTGTPDTQRDAGDTVLAFRDLTVFREAMEDFE